MAANKARRQQLLLWPVYRTHTRIRRTKYGKDIKAPRRTPDDAARGASSSRFVSSTVLSTHGRRRDVVALGHAGSAARHPYNKLLDDEHHAHAQHGDTDFRYDPAMAGG